MSICPRGVAVPAPGDEQRLRVCARAGLDTGWPLVCSSDQAA